MRPLRPATPPDGPLGSSGAAPDPTPVPRPRRPFLDRSTAEPSTAATAGGVPTTVEQTPGDAAQAGPGTRGTAKADAGTTDVAEAGAAEAGVKAADAETGDAAPVAYLFAGGRVDGGGAVRPAAHLSGGEANDS
ncbi:hypothetical protein ABT214_28060, partial [Micromonospora purpureochromogenes]